jgi:hypothetical protein
MKYLRLELKVCEGCGALFFRQVSIDGPYCPACAHHLAGFPPTRLKHAGGRPRHTGPVTRRSLQRRCNGGAQ